MSFGLGLRMSGLVGDLEPLSKEITKLLIRDTHVGVY